MLGFIIGLLVGGFIGMFIMACCVVSGSVEDKLNNEEEKK